MILPHVYHPHGAVSYNLMSHKNVPLDIRELHRLPVAQRIQYKIAMLVNKCLRGLSPPVSRWALPAGRSSHRTSTPAVGHLRQTRRATDSHRSLFPVLRLGTVYQLNCVCRHCPQPPSYDAWKRISSSGLNNMFLQHVWLFLFKAKLFYKYYYLLWTPAQRKRASMLYFADVLFIYLFFYGRLILRPWLTEVRESFTRGGPWVSLKKLLLGFFSGHP